MELKEAIFILCAYNKWRRGAESCTQPDPRVIGEAIDAVVDGCIVLMRERDEAREALRDLAEQLTSRTSSPDPDTAWWNLKQAHQRALELLEVARIGTNDPDMQMAMENGSEMTRREQGGATMSDTPETHAAVERWRQGKINIFNEMAQLERERDKAQALVAEMKHAIICAKARAKERLHRLDQAACERRTWLEAHEKMKRERDEARQALAAIAALPRVEHKYWEESDGHIDESWDESDDGMYLLHYKVAEILREAAK